MNDRATLEKSERLQAFNKAALKIAKGVALAATLGVTAIPSHAARAGTPAERFVPAFTQAAEKERNIFFTPTKTAIEEYRALSGSNGKGPLTQAERNEIRDIVRLAKADVVTYKLPLEIAASLRFASKAAGLDHAKFMQRVSQNDGTIAGANIAGVNPLNVFKFNVPTFLYMIKTKGAAHGLGYFADNIKLNTKTDAAIPPAAAAGAPAATPPITTVTVEVDDPVMLRQIVYMRDNPRINTLMGAEYIQNEASLPQVRYANVGNVSRPEILERQKDYLILGFDLGIKGADGIDGPLFKAAEKEYVTMQKDPVAAAKSIDTQLKESVRQAIEDSEKYTTEKRVITPADAFAIRHAARITGGDFAYSMERISAESGFRAEVKATTSSAEGYNQFVSKSWLAQLEKDGERYGLGEITQHVEIESGKKGTAVAIENPFIRKYALSLRSNGLLNAIMGEELDQDNKAQLEAALPKREITRTDRYLGHFLGAGSAVKFISEMKRNPNQSASKVFPDAAESNSRIFYNLRSKTPKSLVEVYDYFKKKFYTGIFDSPPEKSGNDRSSPKPP